MSGRVALVTGGSRGIGRAIAQRLAADGHRVAVNFRSSEAAADEVVAAIVEAGGEAMAAGGDVGDEAAVGGIFAAIEERWGPVEVLVNNAGITDDGLLLRMSPESWQSVIDTNLGSVYHCTRAALRGMIRARWGRVISITSVSGIAGNAGQSNYSAAKAGIIGFTKAVSREVGSRGVTANAVAPGFIDTDMTGALPDQVKEGALQSIALGRFGEPSEVASVVGYLASDDASYITGQVLVVDGGLAL